MVDNEDGEKSKFKVTDRRRFDLEGNERADGEQRSAPASKSVQSGPQKEPSKRAAEPDDDFGDEAAGITFSSFVMSLATQALMLLGELPAPPGMELEIDPAAAKQTIDVLSILRSKTKGNLDASEQKLLDDVIHNLRLSFVAKSSGK